MGKTNKAIILFSGGLDSTTLLYTAIKDNYEIFPLTFSYSQKHSVEISICKKHLQKLGIENHQIINLTPEIFQGSALTSLANIPKNRSKKEMEVGIPTTYVPVRNLIFLSTAVAYAESINAKHIFIGVNALDYSGYPDCRPDFINSFQETANLASREGREGRTISIHTPLIHLQKHEIIQLGFSNSVPYEFTWSCYDPVVLSNDTYAPCHECDSCILRESGFKKAGQLDPLNRITV